MLPYVQRVRALSGQLGEREKVMSYSTASTTARSGVFYLLVIGIAGVLITVFFFVAALSEISAGRLPGGFGSLVFGVFFFLVSVRVLKLWREARGAVKRSPGQ
jgi:hypothetical protein